MQSAVGRDREQEAGQGERTKTYVEPGNGLRLRQRWGEQAEIPHCRYN